MMRKSASRSSLFSNDQSAHKIAKIDPLQICKQTETLLAQAAKVLPFEQFEPIAFKLLKGLIRRAETQNPHSQTIFLATIGECIERYGSNMELSMRCILLEVLCELNSNIMQQIEGKLQKVKHAVIHTPIQYLLSKVFLLQQRYLMARGDQASALTSLRRCLQLNQSHLVQYLQQREQVRQQIVDNVILAHYQHFRLRKTKKPAQALESLSKALSAARKSYGMENGVVRGLEGLYNQQEHLMNNMERMSSKSRALTEIVQFQPKKYYKASAFYSWEDEKIIAQLLRVKEGERQVMHEATYQIKLDINKIKQLRTGEWLTVEAGRVNICEDQLLKVLGVGTGTQPIKEMTTRIEMRNLSRDQVIRKDYVSSSDDSEDILQREEFKFLKHTRPQSSRKFKQ